MDIYYQPLKMPKIYLPKATYYELDFFYGVIIRCHYQTVSEIPPNQNFLGFLAAELTHFAFYFSFVSADKKSVFEF